MSELQIGINQKTIPPTSSFLNRLKSKNIKKKERREKNKKAIIIK